jgi:hypothetical protein
MLKRCIFSLDILDLYVKLHVVLLLDLKSSIGSTLVAERELK